MIDLVATADGVILPVQAHPGARKNAVTGEHAGRLKVSVTDAPEKGKANQALIRLLAKALGIKRSQITLLAGQSSSQKKFLITGLDVSGLRQLLELHSK